MRDVEATAGNNQGARYGPSVGQVAEDQVTELIASQTCYRAVVQDGLPLIGRVPGLAGAYVATGHSVWGMLNGPATGEAMAELIVDGAASTVDVTPFDPARLGPRAARTADPWFTRPPQSAK